MTNAQATLGNGRFTLHSMLGEKGMARVYRAYDHRLRQWRAIELLLPEVARTAQVRRRFEAETQAVAQLEHPNIARIYEVAADGSQSFIVMELCEGGAVADWLTEHGSMPPRLAVDVVVAACRGMQAAHAAGIVHGDLRPGNLLIDRRGAVKVTGFGHARTVGQKMTLTGSTMGYMSPEQSENAKNVDLRADIYALGATLFTLVTGNTGPQLFAADREPERLAQVPAPLRRVIHRAVAFSKLDRYETMDALREDLEGVCGALEPRASGNPPLMWRRPVDLEPPDEPLVISEPEAAHPVSRATVPDAEKPVRDEPDEPLVQFVQPQNAPEPFLTMTPGTVQRAARPGPREEASAKSRFDDLYVTEVSSDKPVDRRYTDTMVGWKPKPKRREPVDEVPAERSPLVRGVSSAGERLNAVRLPIPLFGLFLLVLILATALVVATQSSRGAQAIEGQRGLFWDEARAFRTAVNADPTLPQELGGTGASAEALREAMLRYRRADTPAERTDAAESLAALMSAEYAVLDLQQKLTDAQRANFGPRVRAIQEQRRRVDGAASGWRAATDSFAGGLAIRLGLATPPPE